MFINFRGTIVIVESVSFKHFPNCSVVQTTQINLCFVDFAPGGNL